MTVKRVMGTETEYAVSPRTPGPLQSGATVLRRGERRRGQPQQIHPLGLSAGGPGQRRARHPSRTCAAARPDMLTDAPQLNITNVIAPNGGRVYVDHAHPEYSAPETTDPFEAVRYDHAGDPHHARPPPNTPANRLASPLPCIATMWMARALLGHARELYDGPRGAI